MAVRPLRRLPASGFFEVSVTDSWDAQMETLGAFIRSQRKLANLSLRQLAELTSLSNPYLSQLERGMHQPSVRVLKLLSGALNVSAEMLLAEAGLIDPVPRRADAGPAGDGPGGDPRADPVEAAILGQGRLDDEQKAALLTVYHSMLRPQRDGRAGH
ncbi:MAG: helix-turn-helix domain-containing protein [Streptosporangiaceae bacterium]|jgi:transcriptional regulator with XRE-family HTH domain